MRQTHGVRLIGHLEQTERRFGVRNHVVRGVTLQESMNERAVRRKLIYIIAFSSRGSDALCEGSLRRLLQKVLKEVDDRAFRDSVGVERIPEVGEEGEDLNCVSGVKGEGLVLVGNRALKLRERPSISLLIPYRVAVYQAIFSIVDGSVKERVDGE